MIARLIRLLQHGERERRPQRRVGSDEPSVDAERVLERAPHVVAEQIVAERA